MREREQLEFENAALKAKLDKSMKYYTIQRVARINSIARKNLDGQKLKRTSQAMEYEVKKTFDANYGEVNAYHLAVWQHEYPHLNYNI